MSAPVVIDVSKLDNDKDRAKAVAAFIKAMDDYHEHRKQQERADTSIAAFLIGVVVGCAIAVATMQWWLP